MFHAARAILFSDGIEARAGTITSNKAIDATFKASSPRDDKRCGVVWHTQGSGKSLTMAFYTGKLVLTLDTLPLWY